MYIYFLHTTENIAWCKNKSMNNRLDHVVDFLLKICRYSYLIDSHTVICFLFLKQVSKYPCLYPMLPSPINKS
jgi:hypothetical protein